jgi:hypothetical protein
MKPKNILLLVVAMVLAVIPTAWSMQEGTKEKKLNPSQLPASVAEAIKNNCPNCVIDKATREVENRVTVYDLEFKSGQGEMDVAVDGSVIDRETVVQTNEVPAPALATIRNMAEGGTIIQIARDEIRSELKDGKVIKLDTPKYVYEADLTKGNQVGEIVVTPEGHVTEGPKWRKKGAKEN